MRFAAGEEGNCPRHVPSRAARWPSALAATGLLAVLCAGWGASRVISDLGEGTVPVRAATNSEAVQPAFAARTVVGVPGSAPSALPALRAKLLVLVVLAAIASLGAGVAAWNLSALCEHRRRERQSKDHGKK